jgi:hypothetical protein
MNREPARLTCWGCGRYAVVLDATDEQRRQQMELDKLLHPVSVECQPPQNSADWIPPVGRLRLPGEHEQPERRVCDI